MDKITYLSKFLGWYRKNKKEYIKETDGEMIKDYLKSINERKDCYNGIVSICSWRTLDFDCLHGGMCPFNN